MNFLKTMAVALIAFVAGAAFMHRWEKRAASCQVQEIDTQALGVQLIDMQGASVAQGVEEIKADKTSQEVTIPSQLSKIELADIETIIGRSGSEVSPNETQSVTEPREAVDLQNVSYRVLPSPQDSAVMAEESKISMIEAPVEVKLINSVEQYREFKRRARGSYPEVDFKKQQVLVLESASNLPDKAFEIVAINEENGKRLVTYRVNVFGLDKKINTHSVQTVEKKDLPLELKQVL